MLKSPDLDTPRGERLLRKSAARAAGTKSV